MKYIRSLVEHRFFEKTIITLIILNGITMGLETNVVIAENYSSFLWFFNILVVSIFTIEALLKIITYKKQYFTNGWNLFDFIIVLISLAPTSGIFQILRIFRVFRLLRLVTIVPQMRKIVSALLSVIPGILSVAALLTIIFYVFAIMTTQLYGVSHPEWFGSLWKSFYTLFQIMTLESWSMGIVRPIMEIHPYAWILFVSFIFIATFVMVNLVIAIVVEAMNKITNNEEEQIINTIEESNNATTADIQNLERKIEKLTRLLEDRK